MKLGQALQLLGTVSAEALERVQHELAISEQRAELLRDHYRLHPGVPGSRYTPCEDPGRYGEDCGRCMRCRSIYVSRPLRS